jgi:DNA gyrase subunit A
MMNNARAGEVLGYIKRLPLSTYRSQNRGGRGIMGMQTREEDAVKDMFIASTHDNLLFFTNHGKAYSMKAYSIPEAGRNAKGLAIVNLLNLSPGEKVAALMPVREFKDNEYIMMMTKKGLVKKTELSLFAKIRKGGLLALNFRDDDELITVLKTDGSKDVFVATKEGMGLKFNESDVRPMGRTAAGVRAIRLADDDTVISADVLDNEDDSQIMFVTSGGMGKRTDKDAFTLQRRGGKGLKIYRLTEKTGRLVGVAKVTDDNELMLINSDGVVIRLRVSDISVIGRVTQGVKLINLADGVNLISMAKVDAEDVEVEEMDGLEGDELVGEDV